MNAPVASGFHSDALGGASLSSIVRLQTIQMRQPEQIECDIRRIASLVVKPSDDFTLDCQIDGTASGISGAFIEALDRADPSFEASEAFHELVVEYANATAKVQTGVVPRKVMLRFALGQLTIITK